MEIMTLLKKAYQSIILTKKLIWFLFNVCCMLPPFKQLKTFLHFAKQKLKALQPKIVHLNQTNQSFKFIFSIYKEILFVMLLVISLAIYVYFKFFKQKERKEKSEKEKAKKFSKQFDEISEKSIIPKTKQRNDDNEQRDSCCQDLQRNLNRKMSNEDKLFLQILKQYQGIDLQTEKNVQFNRMYSQVEGNTNKEVFDNSSTEEGYIKPNFKNIASSSIPKREDDLNKSSVL